MKDYCIGKPTLHYSRSYPSMAAAGRATEIHSTAIGSIASGKGKTAGGFIWKWVKEST